MPLQNAEPRAVVGAEAPLDQLADGVMIEHNGTAFLVFGNAMRPWSFGGYSAPARLHCRAFACRTG